VVVDAPTEPTHARDTCLEAVNGCHCHETSTVRRERIPRPQLEVKTGGYGRILAHPISYPNVFKTDSGSDTDS
jgi:hypothetical protein